MPSEEHVEQGEFDGLKFGHRLLRRGLITPEQLAEAIKVQRDFSQNGFQRSPRLGEILLARGYIGSSHVLEIISEQDRDVLICQKCGQKFNPSKFNGEDQYCCATCGGVLIRKSGSSSSALLETPAWIDLLPPDIAAIAREPGRILGKYVIVDEIGRGACGTVHRAWDHYLGQNVALKLIKTPEGEDGAPIDDPTIQEFLREARTVVRLRHPNIVQVYDVGHVGDRYFMSMEFVDGKTLAAHLHPGPAVVEPTAFYGSPREFLAILRDVALAMDYAHTRPSPVVHRDLKPANILVERSGKPYVVDFGIAKEMNFATAGMTMTGIVKGTPSYMSPEQAEGRVNDIDARTDIYALGAILYEMLCGRPPFIGHGVHDVLNRVINRRPEPPQDVLRQLWKERGAPGLVPVVPPELEVMALKCLEKNPAHRVQRVKDLLRQLERYQKGEPVISGVHRPVEAPAAVLSSTETSPAILPVPKTPKAPRKEATTKTGILMKRQVRPWIAVACLVVAVIAPLATAYVERGVQSMMTKIPPAPAAVEHKREASAFREVAPEISMSPWWDAFSPEIRLMGRRAIEAINAEPTFKFSNFQMVTGVIGVVEVRQAEPLFIVAAVGDQTQQISWETIHPRQVLRMFRSVLAGTGERNMNAMMAYAVQEGLVEEAEVIGHELRGTQRGDRPGPGSRPPTTR